MTLDNSKSQIWLFRFQKCENKKALRHLRFNLDSRFKLLLKYNTFMENEENLVISTFILLATFLEPKMFILLLSALCIFRCLIFWHDESLSPFKGVHQNSKQLQNVEFICHIVQWDEIRKRNCLPLCLT